MLTSLELTLLTFCFNCFSYVSEHTVLFHLKKGFFFPLNKYMLVVFSKHNQGRIDTRQWWKGRCLSGRKSLLWWHLVLPCLIQVSQYILVVKVDGLDTLTCVFRSICWGQTLRFFFWTVSFSWPVEVCSWYMVMWLTLKKWILVEKGAQKSQTALLLRLQTLFELFILICTLMVLVDFSVKP